MKALVLVLALVLSSALSADFARADLPEAKGTESPNVEAGRKAIEAKDYKVAVKHLIKAVEEAPDNADAHNMLGYAYRNVGVFDKSLEHYQRALKLDPNHRSAHEYLGELYLDMKQLPNAEKQLAALKRACPFFGRCAEYEELKDAIDKYKSKK